MQFSPEEVLAEALSHAVAGEYRVLEFVTEDDSEVTQVRDITDHVQELERIVSE
jgi:hypothetical protein